MLLKSQQKLSRTSLIICSLASLIVGLGLARQAFEVSGWLVLGGFLTVLITMRSKKFVALLSVIMLGLLLGFWRGQAYAQKIKTYNYLFGRQVTIFGQADNTGIYDKSQLSFDLADIKVLQPFQTKLAGKISVKGYGENAVYRGDLLQVSGKLYPSRGSRQARTSYAKIKLLQPSNSTINKLRLKFEASMLSVLPEPLASFALGLLIGQRSTIPKMLNDQLSTAGLTHIVAVSGYNLTIIISAVYYFLRKLSKYQATVGSVLLILLFILFTGTSASIIRAAIVSMLSLMSGYYGRSFRPVMLILLAAAMTSFWSPIYLWSDIGWYLSFLAFYGVLLLGPLVTRRIYKTKKPKFLAAVIVETMAAQFMTLPIIMFIFGRISVIALPANVLIVPLVPLAMLLAFVAALGGMIVPNIAGWLALPARIILTYILDIVALAAKIPHAMSLSSLSFGQLIATYGLIVTVCWYLWFKTKPRNGIVTDTES